MLGLCYFFAKMFQNKTESNKYASEYLVVIDDPVSSFDYGNRLGVMSLLRYQFGHILNGNVNSRILVMSHDLHSVFDLVKIRNEVVKGRRPDQSYMELVNGKLDVKFVQNEYKKLIESVYRYAAYTGTDDPDDTMEMGIGNTMRKMMEAYSSFCYNDSFDKMVRKDEVAYIPDPPVGGKKESYGFPGVPQSRPAKDMFTITTPTTDEKTPNEIVEIKLKKAEYMQGHIGEEYEGIISGITEWGVYVELPTTVEGLVHISKLPGDLCLHHFSIRFLHRRDLVHECFQAGRLFLPVYKVSSRA